MAIQVEWPEHYGKDLPSGRFTMPKLVMQPFIPKADNERLDEREHNEPAEHEHQVKQSVHDSTSLQ